MQRGNRREGRWRGSSVGSITNSFQHDLLSPQDCLKEVVSLPLWGTPFAMKPKVNANSMLPRERLLHAPDCIC